MKPAPEQQALIDAAEHLATEQGRVLPYRDPWEQWSNRGREHVYHAGDLHIWFQEPDKSGNYRGALVVTTPRTKPLARLEAQRFWGGWWVYRFVPGEWQLLLKGAVCEPV